MTVTTLAPDAVFDPELHYGDGGDSALYNLFATWPENYFSSLPKPHGNRGVDEPYWWKTLKLSIVARNGEMQIDDVLRLFCSRFFALTNHAAAQQLSKFGMYGFAPDEENMKLAWYQEMFT
ncbi:hypothetical protein VFPBJ_11561 [Purpureocillium lilacinum]|uniref:Uncharacterized protein n=1 Tax=Purpureocillium lilacinum TaxID=33203 RepID=A0A179F4W1_PURLI|nr:hypothetical protein VFPBJ_11561 [Purpureocillium lilacinum]